MMYTIPLFKLPPVVYSSDITVFDQFIESIEQFLSNLVLGVDYRWSGEGFVLTWDYPQLSKRTLDQYLYIYGSENYLAFQLRFGNPEVSGGLV